MRSVRAFLAGGFFALCVPVGAEAIQASGNNPFEIHNGEPGRVTVPVAIQ